MADTWASDIGVTAFDVTIKIDVRGSAGAQVLAAAMAGWLSLQRMIDAADRVDHTTAVALMKRFQSAAQRADLETVSTIAAEMSAAAGPISAARLARTGGKVTKGLALPARAAFVDLYFADFLDHIPAGTTPDGGTKKQLTARFAEAYTQHDAWFFKLLIGASASSDPRVDLQTSMVFEGSPYFGPKARSARTAAGRPHPNPMGPPLFAKRTTVDAADLCDPSDAIVTLIDPTDLWRGLLQPRFDAARELPPSTRQPPIWAIPDEIERRARLISTVKNYGPLGWSAPAVRQALDGPTPLPMDSRISDPAHYTRNHKAA